MALIRPKKDDDDDTPIDDAVDFDVKRRQHCIRQGRAVRLSMLSTAEAIQRSLQSYRDTMRFTDD
jgi:hypothetical protein